ncbi:DUF4349 domain-containing protein [Pedobacter aquatilis]|uniref:DUF4349 domain-containing protein n=1 Tax=Pedobacter aquatilis TaxID=351343 RepID=UPI0025B5A7DB|nr:DUF4349 domain-containing protein [Pedobacter aquatilis]MDN3587936.1 DUF4349 domain-containing protein [Pedobacter aquatilis]
MKRNIIAIAIILGLFACNSEKRDESADATSVAEFNKQSVDTAVSKIIKTADMRFRVRNVQNTKQKLSETIKANGGSLAEFSIQSNIQESEKVKLSSDSLKEITSYRTEGYVVAKVPSEKLDDFTNKITEMAVFVDNASMKMDDQSLNYLANKMKAQNRVSASNQIGKIPSKKAENIESALVLNDDYVDRKIDNMNIDSKVKFSTITLNFYQDNTIKTMIVANDNIYDYKPAFVTRLWLNVVNGWSIFMEVILALANLWMLILASVLGVIAFKYYKARRV